MRPWEEWARDLSECRWGECFVMRQRSAAATALWDSARFSMGTKTCWLLLISHSRSCPRTVHERGEKAEDLDHVSEALLGPMLALKDDRTMPQTQAGIKPEEAGYSGARLRPAGLRRRVVVRRDSVEP